MLEQIISNIRKKLPIQNPLHSFVHNNILQMFEDKDFHLAVAEAGILYRARPYWPVYKYVRNYEEKKIIDADIFRAIEHYLGTYCAIPSVAKLGISPKEFFYRLMFSELNFNDDEVQPELGNNHLWELCSHKMRGQSLTLARSHTLLRGREYWEKYHNESYATSVQPLIIRLISSYLDQGQSFWQNPFSIKSFWEFFLFDILSLERFSTDWKINLVRKVKEYQHFSPLAVIESELRKKAIPEENWEAYLLEILFDLKGWAGMVNKLELEPWQATVKAPPVKLVDYIASVLLVESAMDNYHAEMNSLDLAMLHGRQENLVLQQYQLSIALYQITQCFKLNERWMRDMNPTELKAIIDEIDKSEYVDKVRLWHEAYEHHFHREAILSLASHSVKSSLKKRSAQVLFCIDDREESIRRHLEEIDPHVETYGVVGFFGIDMKFSSVKNKRLIAQCPPVVSPSRVIKEVPVSDAESYKRWNFFRGTSDLGLYYHSRTLFRGFFSTLILGMMSVIPMTVQVFFPQHGKYFKRKIYQLFGKEPETEMIVDQCEAGIGYSKREQAEIVAAVINMCGITDFSEMVVLLAHGSSSNNNPFRQAYGCGACGGNAGIPNSRVFGKMANDKEVRQELSNLGVNVPPETFFVSGFHDTCTDEIFFFNDREIPQKYEVIFTSIKKNLKQAAKLNAYERCQRFSSFDPSKGPDAALRHVRERAHDIAQPRPEYGHSSNALAVVGRRTLTRGLYMNRRSFLLSYDWRTDPDGAVLKQVVLGGVPVAVNINMDYFFSAVDNDNFGCGSKLPLNLTSLLGVMTGSQSDLRIGLARQMVEIHEPIRNLTIIEAPLEKVRILFNGHTRLRNLLYHHWMRLAVLDPETNKWWIFTQDNFEEFQLQEHMPLKHFATSIDLIKKHVEDNFAEIEE
jgi:uncharacterized protein YbcC (UPF0753/DUF2309 family)